MDRHHIIPKHMGGSDDPSNIVELSREDHILAHKLLYEQYDRREDLWASQVLAEENATGQLMGSLNPMWKNSKAAKKGWATRRKKHGPNGRTDAPYKGIGSTGRGWFNKDGKEKLIVLGEEPEGWVRGRALDQTGEKNPHWNPDGVFHKHASQEVKRKYWRDRTH